MTSINKKKGFIKITLILLVTFLSLVMGGFNIGERVGSEQVSKTLSKMRKPVMQTWSQYPGPYWNMYAKPYVSVIWDDILIGTVQANIAETLRDVASNKPTEIELFVREKAGFSIPKNTNNSNATTSTQSSTSTKTLNLPSSNPFEDNNILK